MENSSPDANPSYLVLAFVLAFQEYMAEQMKIMQANDLAQSLLQQGEIKKARQLKEKIRQKRNVQDYVIVLFQDKQWHNHKVIGSKEFIEEKYRQWNLYKDSA